MNTTDRKATRRWAWSQVSLALIAVVIAGFGIGLYLTARSENAKLRGLVASQSRQIVDQSKQIAAEATRIAQLEQALRAHGIPVPTSAPVAPSVTVTVITPRAQSSQANPQPAAQPSPTRTVRPSSTATPSSSPSHTPSRSPSPSCTLPVLGCLP